MSREPYRVTHVRKNEDIYLTEREKEVIQLTMQGCTITEIAGTLDISPHTVQHHRQNAKEALGAENMAHLVVLAVQQGFVDIAYNSEEK